VEWKEENIRVIGDESESAEYCGTDIWSQCAAEKVVMCSMYNLIACREEMK
jgi:hypothetical protein